MKTKTFLRLRSQESEIKELYVSLEPLEVYGIDYYYSQGGKKIGFLFGSKTTYFLKDWTAFGNGLYNTPEEYLERTGYPERKMILSGKIYHKPNIQIFTENNVNDRYWFNSGKELLDYLDKLTETIDLQGMYSEENSKPISLREFIIRERDSLNNG